MKMLSKSLFVLTMVLMGGSLHADQHSGDSATLFSEFTGEIEVKIFEERISNSMFNDTYSISSSHGDSYSTNTITYQYTNDGWLQHVGWYSGCVICTNIAGPREGAQFIIAHNGALMDMCHSYKQHKNHFTNKYPWGEVNSYENYQTIKIK